MRYLGQRYEVNVPLPARPLTSRDIEPTRRRFNELYRQRYGREIRDVPVEAVTFRVSVGSPRSGNGAPRWPRSHAATQVEGRRPVHFGGTWTPACPVYDRYALPSGARIRGPAIVQERESTTVVPPRATLVVDDDLNLVIALGAGSRR
jgi:N-methylhydantoinase A/oxoprolinase/acetone carboxylase beta subunit